MVLSSAQVDPQSSRRPSDSRRVGLVPALLAALACAGCDDEPDCSISTNLSGAFEGAMELNATGRDSCGFANTTAVAPGNSAFAFVGDARSMYVLLESAVISEGSHLGRLMLIVDGNVWESPEPTCGIIVDEFTREEWSKIDFFQVSGSVNCPDPLVSQTDGILDVTVSPVEFSAHIHAEVLSFDFS